MDADQRDRDVSEDFITLNAVMDDHGLDSKWLAAATGRHRSTIYKYLQGELTTPPFVWQRLFAKTRDERIIRLITGDLPIVVVSVDLKEDIYDKLDAPTLKQICRQRKEQIAVEETILDIIADGRINKKDRAAIERYKRNHDKALHTQCRVYQGIIRAFERSLK